MLPYIVIFLGVVYLVLHYSGIFKDLSGRSRRSRGESPGRSGRKFPRELDREIERRLKVFEDFLSKEDPPEDDTEA
jgi:hypothetical protein